MPHIWAKCEIEFFANPSCCLRGLRQMADFDNQRVYQNQAGAATQAIDEGLRAYMLQVYNYMAAGVAITGVVAYLTFVYASSNPAFAQLIYVSPLKWVVMLAPLGMVFFLSARLHKMSVSGAQTSFWIFAALMGLSLSSIFLVYTGQSMTRVFFISAAAFGGLSLYGYTTKRDLSVGRMPDDVHAFNLTQCRANKAAVERRVIDDESSEVYHGYVLRRSSCVSVLICG